MAVLVGACSKLKRELGELRQVGTKRIRIVNPALAGRLCRVLWRLWRGICRELLLLFLLLRCDFNGHDPFRPGYTLALIPFLLSFHSRFMCLHALEFSVCLLVDINVSKVINRTRKQRDKHTQQFQVLRRTKPLCSALVLCMPPHDKLHIKHATHTHAHTHVCLNVQCRVDVHAVLLDGPP